MHVLECFGHGEHRFDRFAQRPVVVAAGGGELLQALVERLPIDELHRQPVLSGGLPGVEHTHDVRVVEPGERHRFALEARQPRRVGGDLGGEHLERDAAAERTLLCFVDDAHAAAAHFAAQFEVAEVGCGREVVGLGAQQRFEQVAQVAVGGEHLVGIGAVCLALQEQGHGAFEAGGRGHRVGRSIGPAWGGWTRGDAARAREREAMTGKDRGSVVRNGRGGHSSAVRRRARCG